MAAPSQSGGPRLPAFNEKDFLGPEGRDLLAALDEEEEFSISLDKSPKDREVLFLPKLTSDSDKEGWDKNISTGRGKAEAMLGKVPQRQPYLKPLDENLEEKLRDWSERQREKDVQSFALPPLVRGNLRRDRHGDRRAWSAGAEGPTTGSSRARRAKSSGLLPQTARQYLWETLATAKERHLNSVTADERKRLKAELRTEEQELDRIEEQIRLHEVAFDAFLSDNYKKVAATLNRSATVWAQRKEQEARLGHFSGLLQESVSLLQEEQERLQEVTAYQRFLAAVTPDQTLKDLRRALGCFEVRERDVDRPGSERNNRNQETERLVAAQPAVSQNYLEEEIRMLRLLEVSKVVRPFMGAAGSQVNLAASGSAQMEVSGKRQSFPGSSDSNIGEIDEASESDVTHPGTEDDLDEHSYDSHLGAPGHLIQLAHQYENQCHTLMALLTRLWEQREAAQSSIVRLQEEAASRLQQLLGLERADEHREHQLQLQQLKHLQQVWPLLADDESTQKLLQQLLHQVSGVMRDVFGSGQQRTLVPGFLYGGRKADGGEGEGKGEQAPPLGEAALLSLLEARFTDLCSQLDAIDPQQRDQIFQDCEKERLQRGQEEKRKRGEEKRNERRKAHLDRALSLPPPRPY